MFTFSLSGFEFRVHIKYIKIITTNIFFFNLTIALIDYSKGDPSSPEVKILNKDFVNRTEFIGFLIYKCSKATNFFFSLKTCMNILKFKQTGKYVHYPNLINNTILHWRQLNDEASGRNF